MLFPNRLSKLRPQLITWLLFVCLLLAWPALDWRSLCYQTELLQLGAGRANNKQTMAKWSIDGLNFLRLRLKWIRSFSEGVPHSCASSIWPVLICGSAARCAVVAHLWLWREIMNSTGDLLRTCQNLSQEDGGENLSSPDLNCEQSLQLNRPGIIRVRRVKQDLRCQDPTLWLHCVGNPSSHWFNLWLVAACTLNH